MSAKKHDPKVYFHLTVHCSTVYNSQGIKAAKIDRGILTLTEEWIKKIWYVYTMHYNSALKKNETMSLAAT